MTITGGGDVSAYNYSWTVANGENAPIVFVEFPHYGALLFFAPDGWEIDCTSLKSDVGKAAPGVCRASVDLPERGIGPGRSRTFRMQVSPGGGKRGSGDVLIRFADGTQVAVAKVELPQEEAMGEKYMPLFGLALMLLIVVIVQCKRAASKSSESQPSTGPADESTSVVEEPNHRPNAIGK